MVTKCRNDTNVHIKSSMGPSVCPLWLQLGEHELSAPSLWQNYYELSEQLIIKKSSMSATTFLSSHWFQMGSHQAPGVSISPCSTCVSTHLLYNSGRKTHSAQTALCFNAGTAFWFMSFNVKECSHLQTIWWQNKMRLNQNAHKPTAHWGATHFKYNCILQEYKSNYNMNNAP